MKKRTVAIFTGNRAEYGLQFPILRAVAAHPELDYRLIVSGAHLDSEFGGTLAEIQHDGFHIYAEVRIDMLGDSQRSTAHAIGTGVISISEVLERIQPDILVVYADRFEGLAAVLAGTQMNIPTAHIEGGDITEGGALDDSVRHAMTKLAHIHFTTNEQASNRVLAMGEEEWRVHTVGFPAIDLIHDGNFATPDEVCQRLSLDLTRPVVLFTQHSVTTEFQKAVSQFEPSLQALEMLSAEGVQILATYPNNDAGGRLIISALNDWFGTGRPGVQLSPSLGRYLYHGVLALAQDPSVRVVCLGNSSSGIKETPAFGCPTVNIGSRQLGRLRASNVIDAGYDANEIVAATRRCIHDQPFRNIARQCQNPYGIGDVGAKVASVLANLSLGPSLLRKGMTLRGETKEGWFR